jgi:hypothetical protein
MLGDVAEDFREFALPQLGPRGARRWYWKQVFRVVSQNVRDRIRHNAPVLVRDLVHGLSAELRYTGRSLAKSTTFTMTCVVTLGIAIAAATMIFSAMDAILLRPLPFPESDRWFEFRQHNPPAPRTSLKTRFRT